MKRLLRIFLISFFLPAVGADESAESISDPLSAALLPDHFVIMRHALAPGGGDPRTFTLDDCTTQRNLSEQGRDQARRIGERLRTAGVTQAEVWTSQWCRCRDTARLLNLGEVKDLPQLNSFFQQREKGPGQMKSLRAWLMEHPLDRPLIPVTHQVVVTGLTDVFPASGEMVLVRRENDNDGVRFVVIARVRVDG